MAKVQTISILAAFYGLLSLLPGCDSSDDGRISELDSLRIVAVRSDLPFAAPSSTVNLEMLVNDASPKAVAKDGTRRKTRLLWLGGCVNPAGDLYYNCFPQLHESLRDVSDEELNAGEDTGNTVRAKLGFGENYQLVVPNDIISGRPQVPQITYPYGVTVMFYTACAGQLRVERNADIENDYPVGCYDPDTNEALGQADFEFGFYPIYAYEELKNQVPSVSSVTFGASASGEACDNHEDCDSREACGTANLCIPRVAACQKDDDCKDYKFDIVVDKKNAEAAASAHVSEHTARRETLWVSYYADFGSFAKDARIINDSASGFTDSYFGKWSPEVDDDSPETPREAHLYAVVRDNRGGVTWVTQDVYVE